jgi:alkylation response protein AidB-like acyl-CoA dehydrogenase
MQSPVTVLRDGVSMYHPNPEQVALARSLGASLSSILPLARLRESHEESAETWKALCDLGVFGISASEAEGGSGLGAADEALIVIELGRRVVTPSVLATVGAAHMRLAMRRSHAPPKISHGLLATALPGEARVAAGYRRCNRVLFVDDSAAHGVLVRSESGAQLFERPTSSRLVDQTLWSSRLLEAGGLGEPLAIADPAIALRLRLIDAAALAGIAQAALEMAVAYARMREQFGRPIGSFQAVKHHAANMALSCRLACDQVTFAALAVDDGRRDAVLQVESAFFVAGSAAIDNAGKNIQIHGGIGFSDEADPHRLLKRARVLVEIAGGLEAAMTRVGDAPPLSAELGAHSHDGRT